MADNKTQEQPIEMVPAPVINNSELSGELYDPLATGSDPLAVEEETSDLSVGAAQQVADTYNMAGLGMITKPVMASDILNEFTNVDVTSTDITSMLSGIREEEAGVQRDAIMAAISNPRVGVEQRVELARELTGMGGYDLNMVSRQAMHNANIIENGGDTPEEIEDMELGAQAAEALPIDMAMETPLPANPEEVRGFYMQLLNDAYVQAEADVGGSDWAGAVVPFRFQVPVLRIYNELGLNQEGIIGPGGNILLGEALKQLREHVETLDDKGKADALQKTLRILKKNAGAFGDGNDIVTMHTLEQVFQKDLLGDSNPARDSALAAKREEITKLKAAGAHPSVIAAAENDLKMSSAPDISGMQVLDNFGSLMDYIGLGSLAKTTIQFGTKWLPKSLTRMKKVAPDLATRNVVDALDDETLRLKFPGLTKEDVLAASLPASHKAIQEGGVNGLGEMIARQLDIRDRLLRISDRSNMSAAERADAFSEIQKMYGDIAAKPKSTLHINESIIEPTPSGVKVEAVFGRSRNKPFSSYAQAAWANRAEIEATFGADAALEVVMRNPTTGLLEAVPKGTKPFTKGEFFLRAKDERAYESAPTTYHSLVLGDKDVANLKYAPSLWKHLRGVTNLMSKDVADNIRLASRQRTEWNKLVAGLTADVAGLDAKNSKILSKVLKEGEQVNPTSASGKTYTPRELRDLGLSETGVRAYYGFRNATDIMYEVVNKQTRTRMLRDGVKDIHTPKGRVGFAQPRTNGQVALDMAYGSKLAVYDPMTGTFATMDRAALDALYKAGGQVAKLETPMLGKGAKEATHVLLDSKAGATIKELPRTVVPKLEGYYPHMWKGNYVVYGLTEAGNRHALGLAANEADARAVVDRMARINATRAAKGKSSMFKEVNYDFDRSLSHDVGKRGAVMEGIYTNMGGAVYGARNGGDLRNFSKAAGDILVDPIEAMLRGMEIVGSKVTKFETATYMRQKLYTYAKSNGLLRDPRIIPESVDDLILTAGKAEQYNKAKAYLDAIDNLLNTRDAVDEAVSKFLLTASSLVTRMGMRAIGSKLATAASRGGDPMSAIMGVMHRTTIATSPLGQGALQASQSLMMLGVAPLQYMKAVGQTSLISMLIGMRASAIHGKTAVSLSAKTFTDEAKVIAKLVGMGEDEVVKVVDTIMDNGLVSAVGYHTQMRNAIRSAAEERMLGKARGLNKPFGGMVGRFARRADAETFGRLSRYGFEAGESINQIATFLTLYSKDKAKGVANLADQDYVRRLIGSVAELTGDMIPETGFTYQRGWFKAAMQFVSFQHKMMLLMLPKSLGGAKSLTAAEKAGMVFAQFLLFGRRGAAHMDAFYRVVDSEIRQQAASQDEESALYQAWNAPETQEVMDGLLFDTAGNFVLKSVFGVEEPDYALAARFAPGGGSEFIADRLWAVASNPTQAIFGLAGEKMSKLYKFAKRVGDVTLANVRGHDDVPLDERMSELGKEGGAQIMSTYNRYLATAAASRLDGWVSAGGRVSEGFAGQLEGALYTQFGIMTKDRESLYEAMDKYREETLTNPLAKQRDLDQLVDDYYKDLIMTAVKFDKQASSDAVWGQLMDKWSRERGLLFSLLPEEDAEYINEKVAERVERAVAGAGDSAETVFIERMSKDIASGRFGSEGPEAALYLEEAEFVKNNPKLLEIIRQAHIEATTDDYLEKK